MRADRTLEQAMLRLAQFEEWTGTKAPCGITEGEGKERTFATDFLAYADRTNLSLDWLWRGDVRGLIMSRHTGATSAQIKALYRRYCDIDKAATAYVYDPADGADEDEVVARLFYNERDAVEAEIMAIPSVTAADMAIKMLVAHAHGDFTCLHYDRDPAWVEARKLVEA